MKKTLFITVVVVIIIAIVASFGLFGFSLRIVYPGQIGAVYYNICSTDATKFNEIMASVDSKNQGATTVERDRKLLELASRIKEYRHYEYDGTCNYILIEQAITAGNISAAKYHFDKLKEVTRGPLYVDTNIKPLSSLDVLSIRIEAMTGERDDSRGE